MTAAAGVLAGADGARTPFAGGASAEELLARALEVIEQQSVRIDDLARQNAELREQNAQLAGASEELRELVGGQAAQLAEANATIAVLQRIDVREVVGEVRPCPGRCETVMMPAPVMAGSRAAGRRSR